MKNRRDIFKKYFVTLKFLHLQITQNQYTQILKEKKLYQSINYLILATLIFHSNIHNKPPENNTLSVAIILCSLYILLHIFSLSQCVNILSPYTGCPKINETHKIANKYVDFNPILYFSDLITVINNNYCFKTPWLGN